MRSSISCCAGWLTIEHVCSFSSAAAAAATAGAGAAAVATGQCLSRLQAALTQRRYVCHSQLDPRESGAATLIVCCFLTDALRKITVRWALTAATLKTGSCLEIRNLKFNPEISKCNSRKVREKANIRSTVFNFSLS